MNGINVQCRLMPDMVENSTGYGPGIYYNLLVSSTNQKGNHVPASVRFRATKALTDPTHSGNGTNWSEPIRTSMFGSVLWSINALTDAQPGTIEVEVSQIAPKGKTATNPVVIEAHPSLNLIGFLQKLNRKTEAEWRSFLIKTKDNTAYAEFASAALFAGCDAVLKGMLAAESRVEALMTECYSDHSGHAHFNVAVGQKSEALFSTPSYIALDETKAFVALLKAAKAQAEASSIAGGVSAWFIRDPEQFMQTLALLLENDQEKLRSLFHWLGLDLTWEAIGDAYSMVKAGLQAGLTTAKDLGKKSGEEWVELIGLFQGLIQKTNSTAGQVLTDALPDFKGIQKDWAATVPDLKGGISINHQQFEFGWISWRMLHSFPQSPTDFNSLIINVLQSCDLNKFLKAFTDLTNAIGDLDPSKEIQEDLTQITSFFAQIIQGDSLQTAGKLLRGGPEMSVMEDLPARVFKVINTITNNSKATPDLVTAIFELVEALFTTPFPMPFMAAIKPWFSPKENAVTKTADESGICLMDCLILMLVTPTIKVYMDVNGKRPPAINQLHDKETWMLEKIPFQNMVKLVINAYEAQHKASEWSLEHPPPMPIPGILSQLPYEEEVFDALILFVKLMNGLRGDIEAVVKIAYEAEDKAEKEAASVSGEEDLDEAAETVDWKPVIKKLIFGCFASFDLSFKGNINLLETAKLYLLDKDPKAKFAHIGEVDVVVFNPVYPEWVGLARELFEVTMDWCEFTVELILAINEDEELASGAADFEISGAIYTVTADAMKEFVEIYFDYIVPAYTFIPNTVLKVLTWTNLALYYKSDLPDIRPMAQSAFADLNTGDGPSAETKKNAANLAKYADPTYNFTVTKIVLAIGGAVAEKVEKASGLIAKIPEVGPALAFEWTVDCIVAKQFCEDASLAIEVYEFQEKYHVNEQAESVEKAITNH